MYLVGMVGFYINPDYFAGLTSVHLWVVNVTLLVPLLFSFQPFVGVLLVAALGFTVEVIGVETSLVFGEYHYGNVLGKLFGGVPIIIGLNWAVLLFSAYSLIVRLIKNKWIASIIIAASIAGLDFLIEPVAISQQYWFWPNNVVPVQNYIAWFVLSFLFVQIYYAFKLKPVSHLLAGTYLGMQLIFFIYLQLLN